MPSLPAHPIEELVQVVRHGPRLGRSPSDLGRLDHPIVGLDYYLYVDDESVKILRDEVSRTLAR